MASFSNSFLGRSGRVYSPTLPAPKLLTVTNRAPLQITAKYRGLNTDLRKVPAFQLHDKDTGSTQVQIARFSARVTQLTEHLKVHKQDYASTRGLQLILGKRRRLLQYLYDNDRDAFNRCINELKIRFRIRRPT